MLKRKAYYLETEWVIREMDGQTPEVLFIGEDKDEKWLMEVLGFDWEQLLDFMAYGCLRFLKEVGGIHGLSNGKPVEIVSPDEEERWEVVGIDLDQGMLIIKDEYSREYTYPIPSDIGPDSDATIGNTGANWWTVIRGCAVNFFPNYHIGHDAFVDMINERIAGKLGLVVYYVYLKAIEIRITGKEMTFYTDGSWKTTSPMEVYVAFEGSAYFPVYVSSQGNHIFLSFLYEGFAHDTSDHLLYYALRSSRHYLYYKPGNSIGFVGGTKDNKVKVSMKTYQGGGKLMLGENAWIRLLLIKRERNGKVMPHLAIQMTKYRGEEPGDFALLRRWRLPLGVLNSLLERIGSA